jgi:hypothetical protein
VYCRIDSLESGLLGMRFELPDVSDERRDQICEIREMHDTDKMTFRQIAEQLEITKSSAQRLYAEWRPELAADNERSAGDQPAKEPELALWQDEIDENVDYEKFYREHSEKEKHPERWTTELLSQYRFDASKPLITCEDDFPDYDPEMARKTEEFNGDMRYFEDDPVIEIEAREVAETGFEAIPFAAGLGRRGITDLDESTDGYGQQIFVEQWDARFSKPVIWYKRAPDGYHRMERSVFGVTTKRVRRAAVAG